MVLRKTAPNAQLPTIVTDPFRTSLKGVLRLLREQVAGGDFFEPALLEGLPQNEWG
jgi:hypothetical protein